MTTAAESTRLDEAVEAKERLAGAAVRLLEPGDPVFLDCSTTAYHLARRIIREGPRLALLTNSVAVMESFMKEEAPKTDTIGVGGTVRKLALSFVGPHASSLSRVLVADALEEWLAPFFRAKVEVRRV